MTSAAPHPLVVRVLAQRRTVEGIRATLVPRSAGVAVRRVTYDRQEAILSGLEQAAALCLGAEDLAELGADLRTEHPVVVAVTPGQLLARTLCRTFAVTPRSPRRMRLLGSPADLHHEMVGAILNAVQYPGYYGPETTAAYRPGFGAALAYQKHVRGNRASAAVIAKLNALSPWDFAQMLGQMADAGVTNVGEGERFWAGYALLPGTPAAPLARTA